MKPLSLALFGVILLTACQDTAQITQPEAAGAPQTNVSLLKTSGGTFAYVLNWRDSNVSVIDLATNTVVGSPILVGGAPRGIAITPNGTTAYAASAGKVSVIDLATNTVVGSPIPAGLQLSDIAITPDGTKAYVTRNGSGDVSVIDLATNTVVGSPIPVGLQPNSIAITPDGTKAYVANRSSHNVSVIDLATNTVVGSPIDVGRSPNGIAITPDGTTAYVANQLGISVSVIDVGTNTVVGLIFPVGFQPYDLAITPDGTKVYVTNLASDNVVVIDVATNTLIGSPIPVGDQPRGIAITPDGTTAYVVNGNIDNVSVIDLATNTVVGSPIPVGGVPWAIAIMPVPLNEPPEVATDTDPIVMSEGQTANNTGTVSDPDGDNVTLSASVGSVTNNNDGTWSWSFGTTDGPAESQTVTITADDGNGGEAQTTFTLTVNNVAPTVTTVTVPGAPVAIDNQPVSANGTFTDPAGTADETYTCTVEYGDGPAPQAGTVAGMTCTGPNQTYAEAGIYSVTVAITDKDGGTGNLTAETFIVIYDPSGGFVTGGGWIDSPAGAYIADPSLTGKANFGFVSKYKKGATVPTGSTQFQFKTGGLNFHSSSYDFLVITMGGTNAQYKGSGTVNDGVAPTGNEFKFMIWARDDNPDTFRIKIWYEDGGEVLVYDNGFDQPIGGGSIVIHTK